MITYTNSEKTVKRHTIQKAIDNATILLKGRYGLCVDALKDYREGDLLTTVELNDLVAQLVFDSEFYAY